MAVSFVAKEQDPYVDNIVRNLPEDVKATFTQEQADALLGSLSKAYIGARHMIDKRGTINLFIARYYIVFLMGRDQRTAEHNVMVERRKRVSFAVSLGMMAFLLMNVLGFAGIIIFAFLYLLKSAFGINLLANRHMLDLLQ